MKILHLNAGNETGGGMHHILSLLKEFNREEFILGVLEKGELLKRANGYGIKTVHFSNHLKISVPLMQKIANYIRQERINYIHTHGPRANVYANILKKIVPFHWIVTVHSDPEHDFLDKGMYGRFLCRIHLNAIKNADKVIAISEPFRTNLNGVGVEYNKIVTALNGIDFRKKLPKPHFRNDLGFTDNDFLFFMVARLEQVKGHSIAFEAFSQLVKKNRACHMLLAGDGTLRNHLKQLSSSLNIEKHVHFMGHRDDVERFYEMVDTTMLTSFSESFPLVLLESARAKTPIIASDVGGISELIGDNSLGWRVKPGNTSELISAMEEAIIFRNRGMLKTMGEKLQSHASSKFSLEIFAENIYNVYLSMENVN
ncbi:glycosyltransferase family 4 protein [Virgibacillus oceani]|uniref:Glycosyl transferase n=1 Tax=Virgibacillus oceani TaxID=1479511 RepID=A0A917M1K5_9BACI|nr:glycosyltransferase family 4 protein [Virgibacillus oceani]GGG73325.1 glycosyl transferase [Virgibacillus oceani]